MGGSCGNVCRKIQSPKIETDENGKAKSFRLFSIARPHMRSFHSSWFCFFVAFTSWFGIQPLLPTIQKDLGLSKVDLAHSGTASIAATIAVRVIIGPLCDKFGPKRIMTALLLCGAVPMALTGLVANATGLIILRLFVGILGGTFVPCQFWTTAMFNSEVVGTANALVGGWGNLGGGFTFILMPYVFELVKICGADEFLAWKIAVVIPSFVCMLTGISIIFTSDDCPQGKWKNRKLPIKEPKVTKKQVNNNKEQSGHDNLAFDNVDITAQDSKNSIITNGTNEKDTPAHEKVQLSSNIQTIGEMSCKRRFWTGLTVVVFILQYGMCFGIEISVNTVMNLYFLYTFKKDGCTEDEINSSMNNTTTAVINRTELSSAKTSPSPYLTTTTGELYKCSILDQNTASLIASLFGLMNLFARALGGISSDVLFRYRGTAGRLLMHFLCLFMEGLMLLVFSQMETIPSAVVIMVLFSLFTQMSEGTTYGIVPYIIPRWVGVVAGFVGAGGNAGALLWTTIWSALVDINPSQWFWILGIITMSGSLLTFITEVQGIRIWHIYKKYKSYEPKRQTTTSDTKL